MNSVFKLIRRFTVPPVFAAALLIIIYASHPDYFGSIWHLAGGLIFLCALPTLAYPMQKYIPKYKDRGREGQRTLAMIFSFAGYLFGTLTAFVFAAPAELKVIYLEYLFCGIGILLFNKVIKIKASGHACGIVGPVILLVYFGAYIPALVGATLVFPVYISSVKTKQHTPSQLVCGSIIPAVVLAIIALCANLIK